MALKLVFISCSLSLFLVACSSLTGQLSKQTDITGTDASSKQLKKMPADLLLSQLDGLDMQQQSVALRLLSSIDVSKLNKSQLVHYRIMRDRFAVNVVDNESLALNNGFISALASDNNDLWLGDDYGSLVRYTPANNEHFIIRTEKPGIAIKTLSSIYSYDDEVWATAGDGLLRYSKINGTISFFPQQGYPVSLCRYRGSVWLATLGAGLWYFNDDGFNAAFQNNASLKSVRALVAVNDLMWAITNEALWRYNGLNWEQYSFDDRPIFVQSDGANGLLIGGRNGLYRYNNERIERLIKDYGFISAATDKKKIYAVTEQGFLISFDNETGKITNLSLNLPASFSKLHSITLLNNYLVATNRVSGLLFVHRAVL
jgi:ligand-binding sensor domain-containing protein